MSDDLNNTVVLVTGGTSGIGLATAELLLKRGAKVAINGRETAKGKRALGILRPISPNVIYIQGDVSQIDECSRIVEEAADYWGKLDAVVNSAGFYQEKSIAETTADDLKNIFATNFEGTYFICKYSMPVLKEAGRGSIVNISSDAGLQGNLLCTAYCAAKGAVVALTRALALEAAPYGIRVNCVCPGDVATPMLEQQLAEAKDLHQYFESLRNLYPLGRIAEPMEVAQVICFLISPAASFVTGAVWTVDGGLTSC